MENRLSLNDKTVSWLMAYIVVNNIVAISLNIGNFYYIICGLALCIILFKDKSYTINKSMLLVYLACCISLLINHVPAFFKSWDRLFSFILITSLISPFIESNYLKRFRIRIFSSLFLLYQFIVLASLFLHFAGINFYSEFHYTGITKQSMLLAPVSALVSIYATFKLTIEKKYSRIYYYYYSTILVSAILTLLLSASRVAIAGALAGISIYLVTINRNKLHRIIKWGVGLAAMLTFTFTLWSPYLNNLEKKNEASMSSGGMTSSRDLLWATRIEEFKSSPLFGIGFSTIDINQEGAYFDKATGMIETGSSWLSILSMLGIVGFTFFLLVFINSIRLSINLVKRGTNYGALLLSLLIFWSFHMTAEGYIFASGSFLCFNIWLLIGYIHIIGNSPHYINAFK